MPGHRLPPALTAAMRCAVPLRRFKAALGTVEGQVTMGHFREGRPTFMGAVAGLFAGAAAAVDPAAVARGDPQKAAQQADAFIAINASTIELADLGAPAWALGCRAAQGCACGGAAWYSAAGCG